jgi:hypothetical protein
MKKTIYAVSERNRKVTAQLIRSVREQKFTPTFKIISETPIVSTDACVVELIVQIQQDQFLITGSARRARGDRSDPEVGYYVAVSRAYASLAKKLERRAAGLVQHHDDVQIRQRKAKEAATQPRTAATKKVAAAKRVSRRTPRK